MGKRKKDDAEISLFSFLNVMTATIGVQALMLVIFALQIKPGVQAIRLLPSGGAAKGSVANFVICNGEGELILVEGSKPRRLINIQGNGTNDLEQFMDQIESKQVTKKQYIVIGVRPNGYTDFEVVRSKAESRRLKIGYEPLEEGLEINFPEQTI